MRSIYARIGTLFALLNFGMLPLCADTAELSSLRSAEPVFHANAGQWTSEARFICRLPGMDLWVSDSALTIDRFEDRESERRGHVARMRFAGAHSSARAVPVGSAQYERSYRSATFSASSGAYSAVEIHDLYRGVDLALNIENGRPRYDFHLRPGADPAQIGIAYEGVDALELDSDTTLILHTAFGPLEHRNLYAYQLNPDGSHERVDCRFVLRDDFLLGFEPGDYDPTRSLVIDPLIYSTYLGGYGDDRPTDIALHGGKLYLTGTTTSQIFPDFTGVYKTPLANTDIFVTRLSASGDRVEATAVYGGSRVDVATSIAVMSDGNVLVGGWTQSADFPTSGEAQQADFSGLGTRAAFLLLLRDDMDFIHGTYYGGAGLDGIEDITVRSNVLHCVGSSSSIKLPGIVGGVVQPDNAGGEDAFYVRFLINPGAARAISPSLGTFLGGTGTDRAFAIHVGGSNIYVAGETTSDGFPVRPGAAQLSWGGGRDMFVSCISRDVTTLNNSTYWGGPGHEGANSIAVFENGAVLVGGNNQGGGFPPKNAYSDTGGTDTNPVVVKMKPGLGIVDYSSYLGHQTAGVDLTRLTDLTLDPFQNVIVVGSTASNSFDVSANAEYPDFAGGSSDAWMIMMAPYDDIEITYASYFGGNQSDEATAVLSDGPGRFYLVGHTTSAGSVFPVTPGAIQQRHLDPTASDAFATHIRLGLELLAPNGGGFLCTGNNVQIRWEGIYRESTIHIGLKNESTGATELIAANIDVASGVFSWEVSLPGVFSPESDFRIVLVSPTTNRNIDSSDSVFSIYSPPIIVKQSPADTTVCVGTSPAIFAQVAGYPEPRFIRWEESASAHDNTWQSIRKDPPRDVGDSNDGMYYRAVFANECDTTASAPIRLKVDFLDAVLVGGGAFCIGSRVNLRVVEPPDIVERDIAVRWEVDKMNRNNPADFEVLPGETGTALTFTVDDESRDGWRYRVFLLSRDGCTAESNNEILDIFPGIEFTDQPQSQVVCAGEQAEFTFDVGVREDVEIEWQWRRPGTSSWSVVPGSASNKRLRPNTNAENDGRRIRAAVSYCNDTVYTVEAVLRVIHPGQVQFVASDTLDLGLIETCNLSALGLIELRNESPVELTVRDLQSADPGISLVGTSPNPIPPGGTAGLSIAYSPGVAGLVDVRAHIKFEECEMTRSMTVMADVRGERPRLEPRLADFGSLARCSAAVYDTLRLTAPPDVDLNVFRVEIAPPFMVDPDLSTPIFLRATETLSIPVSIEPGLAFVGQTSETLSVEYTAANCLESNVLDAVVHADLLDIARVLTPPDLEPEIFECEFPYDGVFEIRNTGALPLSLSFSGDVQLISPPQEILPDAAAEIAFRIEEPSSAAPLRLIITYEQCGLQDTLEFNPDVKQIGPINVAEFIDFGAVRRGASGTAVLPVVNSGDATVRLTAVDNLPVGLVLLNQQELPRDLESGETCELSFRLVPTQDVDNTTLQLTFDTPCGESTATVTIKTDFVNSYSLGFAVRSGIVEFGDTIDVVVSLNSSEGFDVGDYRVNFELEYNSTILAPVDPGLESRRDRARAAIRIDTVLPPAQTEIATIPMMTGWGNSTTGFFEIVEASVSDSDGREVEPLEFTQSLGGVLLITGISPRYLINPVPGMLYVTVANSPMNVGDPLELDVRGLPDGGGTLEIFDSLGRSIYSASIPANGLNSFPDAAIANAGVYFCLVSVGDAAVTRPFVVN